MRPSATIELLWCLAHVHCLKLVFERTAAVPGGLCKLHIQWHKRMHNTTVHEVSPAERFVSGAALVYPVQQGRL